MRHHHHSGHHGRHGHGGRDARDFFEGTTRGDRADRSECADFLNARFAMRHPLHALHALRHAMGRRGGEGHGDFGDRFGDGFGRGFGGPGGFGDGDGFGRGRKFTSEDLQLMLLALLAERPSHGYELIKALDSRSNGFYSPSPGMVYPALTYLEELGYVSVTLEGNRKRYELSDEGRAHLDDNRERADLILAKLTHFGRKMDLMRRAFAGEDPADGSGWTRELIEARRALKRALLRRTDASPEEQRRIAAILVRATQEIENGGEPVKTDDSANSGE
ncbi:PadR family transcriptional regulator [Burkholderia sp. Ax-1719]|uniref:PadR family transcriptional regulator n=1 Tax=Burkholderia sp. Ax-1719 TaxID=2608334 RepID=UPI0014210079|nr:PadR family transcriptional regulator [Burkholderia sp. Ax-1719]NIE65912.1 PadR family transcriptional regulator [Burkholderia sp. Ax-1719]